jgi:hypothetical protein
MVGPDKVYWIGITESEEAWQRATSDRFDDYLVVGGHAPASTFHKIRRPKVFATTVRDPVERAVSYFHFVTEIATDHPLNAPFRDLGFMGTLKSRSFAPQFANLQCSWISGKAHIVPVLATLIMEGWIIRRHDQLEEMMREVAWRFRWPMPVIQRLNAAPAPYYERICTPKIERRLRRLNTEDLKLWTLLS